MSVNELPVIDLADAVSGDEVRIARAVEALRLGFGYYGLVCLKGYDEFYLSKDGKTSTFELYDQFVELLKRPREELRNYGGAKIWFQRGYTPPNTEVGVASGGKPDLKECWFNQCGGSPSERCKKWYPEIYADNIWPEDADSFRNSYTACGDALNDIGKVLLQLSEFALKVPAGSFTEKADQGPHVSRLLRYLALDDELAKQSVDGEINWGEEHTDMNLITILPGGAFYRGQDRQPPATKPPGGGAGLYLRARPTKEHPTGRKVSGTPPPGCFIAQVGQQLEVLTGGAFIATPHHIVAPTVPGWSRCAMAHFVHLRGDSLVAPVCGCEGAEADADMMYAPPVLAGTYVLKTLVDIGLAGAQQLDKLGYRNYGRLNEQRALDAESTSASSDAD
jgi:isopenicillin N synthase-like dioxygenase